MHLIEAFVRNPVKIAVGVLLVVLFGGVALVNMPMQLTPEVQVPTISIRTRWPGASPREIEREIIREQEDQLKGVEGSMKMTSESRDSEGSIEIEFQVGTDIEAAMVRVNRRLQQVPEYPEEADEPVITTSSVSSRSIAWFILSPRLPTDEEIAQFQVRHPDKAALLEPVRNAHSPGLGLLRLRRLTAEHPELAGLRPAEIDLTKLRKYCEDVIEARFERVAGVSESNIRGGREPELQVIVDPRRLSARQLTISQLRTALRSQNKDTSGGDFWEGKRRYVVRTLGQFRSPEQVANQIVAVQQGAPVYVRDVAQVRLGHKKPTGVVRRYGDSCIAISAARETGANVLDVMKGLRAACQELNDGPLRQRNLVLTQVYDETDYIYSAIKLVVRNIVVGGLLTIGVLLLFLRSGRSTLVIGLAIPTSIVGTFLMLYLAGRSLNVISLAGLAFAVGMLVDNAVVVLENIYRHYQDGEPPFSAAVVATQEVWGAVVASTLTTLAVFLPILFVQEEAGQLFRDIALAISFAVGLSLLISVTVIPTAAARIFHASGRHSDGRPPSTSSGWPGSMEDAATRQESLSLRRGGSGRSARQAVRQSAGASRLGQRFVSHVIGVNRWILRRTWRRLAVVAALVCVSVAGSILLWPNAEYLPTGNRNLVFGIMMAPPGYNLEQQMKLGEIVEDALRPYWDVDPDSSTQQQIAYPAIQDFFYIAYGRRIFVGLRAVDPTQAGKLVPLVREVGGKVPGTSVVASQSSLFERGLGAGRSIDIEITGPDIGELVALGRQIMDQIQHVLPDAQSRPEPSLDLSSPEIHVEPKPVQMAELAVSNTDLGYTVNALVDGAFATDYYIGGEKVDLTIIGESTQSGLDEEEDFRRYTQDLETLPIATPTGQLVMLSDVAGIRLSSGPEQINHRERQRAITIQVTPPVEIALEDAIRRIERQIIAPLRDSGQLASEYLITLSGTADKLRDTWIALRWNLLLALIITYLLMAALFESWLYPLVIICSVPLGAVGGIAAMKLLNAYLWLIDQPPQTLDVLTMLGFIILIGTVVNNAILIVHQSLNHMRSQAMSPQESILESVRTRIRPIFMTTATTVFGLAPLVFFPGAGSELYRGLGSVVLGGLVVSSIFTLVLIPTLFSLLMDLRQKLLGGQHAAQPKASLSAEPSGTWELSPEPRRGS